ncbi:general substrate transporter [Pilaira anomala]|nr:general substrate transporter [Pilaira anomala]
MKYLTHVTTIVSSIGGLLFGYDIGIMSGVFETPTFPTYFGMEGNTTESQQIKGNIVSFLQAGACLGALIANFSADKIGRQRSIMIATVLFLFGSAIQTGAKNLAMMLFGRFAAGWGVGACTMLIPMYIAEISTLNMRGRMGALWQLNISVGMMLSFWVNYACLIGLPVSDTQWRLPLGLQLVPGVILFTGMFFLPESIRWLVLQDRTEEAKVVLCKLRSCSENNPEALDELNQILEAVESEREQDGTIWKELMEPWNRRRLAIGCFMQIAQQWTGTNAINYYGPLIFQAIGLDSDTSVLMTGIYDKKGFGRRPLLLIGSVAFVIIFCILGGTLFSIQQSNALGLIPSAAQGYVAMVMIYLFAVFFEFTWGPVPWIVCSEIFSNRIRAICISVTTSMNWGMNAIIGKVTPLMISQIKYGTFFFYAACCFVAGVIVYVFLPETMGRSLEEMTEIFVNGNVFVLGKREKSLIPMDVYVREEVLIDDSKNGEQ